MNRKNFLVYFLMLFDIYLFNMYLADIFTEDVVEAFLRLVEQEKLRAPDDDGGGNMTEIDNVK